MPSQHYRYQKKLIYSIYSTYFSRYIGINKNQCLDLLSRENPIKPKRRAIMQYNQAGKSINFASSIIEVEVLKENTNQC